MQWLVKYRNNRARAEASLRAAFENLTRGRRAYSYLVDEILIFRVDEDMMPLFVGTLPEYVRVSRRLTGKKLQQLAEDEALEILVGAEMSVL